MQVTKINILLLLFVGMATFVWAQPSKKIPYDTYLPDSVKIINLQEKPERKKYDKPLKSELSFGARMPYRGWGIFVEYGFLNRKESYKKWEYDYMYNARSITLEIGERFHGKEEKPSIFESMVSQVQNYTPGKKSNLYHAKLMFNNRMLLAGKQDHGNIGVHWILGLGAVIGLQKPYYLNVANVGTIKYNDTLANEFVNGMVLNRNYFKGFSEIEIVPGAILKTGFQFDIARNYKRISTFEIGGTLEYFFSEIDMMVGQKPQQLFAGFYLSYQFGKRR